MAWELDKNHAQSKRKAVTAPRTKWIRELTKVIDQQNFALDKMMKGIALRGKEVHGIQVTRLTWQRHQQALRYVQLSRNSKSAALFAIKKTSPTKQWLDDTISMANVVSQNISEIT